MFVLAFLAALGLAVFGVVSVGWVSLFGTIPLFGWWFVIVWAIYTFPLLKRFSAELSEKNLSYIARLIMHAAEYLAIMERRTSDFDKDLRTMSLAEQAGYLLDSEKCKELFAELFLDKDEYYDKYEALVNQYREDHEEVLAYLRRAKRRARIIRIFGFLGLWYGVTLRYRPEGFEAEDMEYWMNLIKYER